MFIILCWVGAGLFCGWAANKILTNKGRNGIWGAIVAGVIGVLMPIAGFVVLAVLYFAVSSEKTKNSIPPGFEKPQINLQPQNIMEGKGSGMPPVKRATSSDKRESQAVQKLRDIELLKSEGLISEEEYNTMRQDVLRK